MNHELMNRVHRVTHAWEEIKWVHVELCCLHTWIVDEEKHFVRTLDQLSNFPLHAPVLDYVSQCQEVNKLLMSQIEATYTLPNFTGDHGPGKAIHPLGCPETYGPESDPSHLNPVRRPHFPADESGNEGPVELDDEFTEGIERVTEFIGGLAL